MVLDQSATQSTLLYYDNITVIIFEVCMWMFLYERNLLENLLWNLYLKNVCTETNIVWFYLYTFAVGLMRCTGRTPTDVFIMYFFVWNYIKCL